MLTAADLQSIVGRTVADAEIVERGSSQVLRLHLDGGGVLAISQDDTGLSMSDESSIS